MADYRYGERSGRDDRDRYGDGGRYERERERERERGDGGGMFGFGRSRDDPRGGDRDDWRSRERGGRSDRHEPMHRDREQRPRAGGDSREDRDRGYGSDDSNRGLPMDETSHLIASNKVEGTNVYGADGHRLGSIHNFMVDKLTGKVEYAVMTYSTGFLGMGTRYYPLPWRTLGYDKRAGGYRIELTERDLRDAPSFDRETEPRFDRNYGSRVHDYYGLKY